jgi:ferredoxin
MIIRREYPEKWKQWQDLVVDFARAWGKSDPVDYFDSGAWKMKVGYQGANKGGALLLSRPCLNFRDAKVYVLSRIPAQPLGEMLLPLGDVVEVANENNAFECYVKREGIVLFHILQLAVERPQLRVRFIGTSERSRVTMALERQLRKFQSCVLCGACVGLCPSGAIHADGRFHIDRDLCTSCQRCASSALLRFACVAVNTKQYGLRSAK